MRWQMTWGQYSDDLIEGGKDPANMPFLASQPELNEDEQVAIDAFQVLSSSRVVGMGMGQIPFSEISHCANVLDVVDFWAFVQQVQAIDQEFCAVSAERAKS